MLPGRIWAAGRILALRKRPTAVRSTNRVFRQAKGTPKLYSDESNGRPNKPAGAPDSGVTPSSAQTGDIGEDGRHGQNEKPEHSADETHDSFIDTLDDAVLDMYNSKPLTRAQENILYDQGRIPSPNEAEAEVETLDADDDTPEQALTADASADPEPEDLGHKFGIPEKPYPPDFHLKKRYHPVLDQITKLLMRDGKLSVAQKQMATVMNFLRTSPAPIYSPKFPLLPGTPPASHLPLDPTLYITIAIDSVAPLIQISRLTGAAGGGRALEIPRPIAVRQRRRIAFQWIMDVIKNKPSRGSGRKQFPYRIADEIIAVVEGRSSVWEKRRAIHKLGTVARANIGSRAKTRGKKSK
ncbi:hypothetical protein XA68_17186 [Ophiocordyceps unilateralis]|uniref:Small ribosomal subunit protein uS7 domain-containing protein n=1 Tax=Ophiocordyceps unilateralis TaxID=268505 RepID=A0A2A9P3G1_OPHUN|nr:hypothetical protein XA68_17186 [Ophiocordyceps unilateralis]